MSETEDQDVAGLTLSTLKSFRNDASFDLFWQKITASAEDLNVDKLALPRCQKAPHHFDDGSAPTFHTTVEEHYRVLYFEHLISYCKHHQSL